MGLVLVTVCVLLAWATTRQATGTASDVLRTSAQIWLAGHGTSVTLPAGGSLGLTPLGLTLGLGCVLWRVGRNIARYVGVARRQVAEAALAVAVPYATVAALLATPAATSGARPEPWHALVGSLALAGVAVAGGLLREVGGGASVLAARPRLGAQLTAAASACAVLTGGAMLLVVAVLVANAGQLVVLWKALAPGVSGSPFLALACLALVPNVVVWAVAVVLGPGFALGTGTTVSPFGVELGPLPAFPLLAGTPSDLPGWALVLLVLPVAAGVVAGVIVERSAPSAGVREAAAAGAGTGGLVGLAVAVLCAFASGPVGPGRLAEVGASPLVCGLAAAVEVGAVAALVAVATVWWRRA